MIVARSQSIGRSISLLVLAIVGGLAPGPAFAGHGDNGSSLADRDNNSQGVIGYNLTEAGHVACNWGADRLNEDTVITVIQPDPSDIHCYDDDSSMDWFGYTTCEDVFDGSSCDHYRVMFNLRFYGQINADGSDRYLYLFIGCHEFGHTSSVGHRPNGASSCMDDASGKTWLDDHDRYAINHDY